MMRINRKHFFASIRPLFGAMGQGHVDGCNAILAAWESSGLKDLRWLAYMLATTYHETASRMQPIKEYGGPSYFKRMYDINGERPHVARELGNVHPGDGATYYGRGYVQITGRRNYARASDLLGADLVGNPNLALRPDHAARIMFDGMTRGWFTGRKLSDYISGSKADYFEARRIINGLDKATLIAGHARAFEKALRADRAAESIGGGAIVGGGVIAVERASDGDWVGAVLFVLIAAVIGAAAYFIIKKKRAGK